MIGVDAGGHDIAFLVSQIFSLTAAATFAQFGSVVSPYAAGSVFIVALSACGLGWMSACRIKDISDEINFELKLGPNDT